MALSQANVHGERFESCFVEPISPDSSVASDDDKMEVDTAPSILRIAIDFGTTFSSVAYARTTSSQHVTMLRDISCVTKFPGDCMVPQHTRSWEPRQDVPTELLYLRAPSTLPGFHDNASSAQDEDPSDVGPSSDTESDHSSSSGSSFDEHHRPTKPPRPSLTDYSRDTETLAWGFEVQDPQNKERAGCGGGIRMSKFKLILDKPNSQSEEAIRIQSDTMTNLDKLKRLKLIKSHTDIITHFLEKLFVHVKAHLQAKNELKPDETIEFTLCVPAEWPAKACRIMQDAMAKAAQKSGLGALRHGSLENVFIVSEPEAAAACILAEGFANIYYGETIVILDAGGGTVDAITYKVTNSDPLRMSAEVVPPKTDLCGASYINEEFEKFLQEKLRNETYLEKNGKTIRSIIDQKVIEFENLWKRVWNMEDKNCQLKPIWIDDLRPSSTDRQLTENRLEISPKDVKRIFRKSIRGTIELLKNQIEMAHSVGEKVQKVILTGGFGQSPYLQSKIKRFLKKHPEPAGHTIELLMSDIGATAVARGAVLRASNKELSPVRISSCSYGFLLSEPYNKDNPAHKATKPRVDRVDGEKYVHHTINWLFQKGDVLGEGKETTMTVMHTFAMTKRHLICEELLYVSDDKKESHYRATHAKNKGAEVAGSIVVDMTFLRDEGHIQPEAVHHNSAFVKKNKKIFVVKFDLLLKVSGRNLIYEARWPCKNDIAEDGREGEVQARGQLCIAATFKPGTA